MSRPVPRAPTGLALLAATAAAALAGDPPDADAKKGDRPTIEGDLRAGYRLLVGEDEGRFETDVGLTEGPRLFDLNVLATDPRERAPIDEAEIHLTGIGDRNSDCLGTVRKRDVFEVSGGYRRDDFAYDATGDPFSYDTLRERSFVHGRWTPNRDLTVRVEWDRNQRTGDSDGFGFSAVVPLTPPFVQSPESFPQTRDFTQRTDDFTLGADYAVGIFRFGLTQIVRLGEVDDSRSLTTTSSGLRLFDDIETSSRSRTYATVGKAGVVVLDGKLDATLFVTRMTGPLEVKADGDARALDSDGAPERRAFHTDSDIDRSDLEWRLESSWRPLEDWEFTAAGEYGNLVVDESADLDGRTQSPVDGRADFRITDRTHRWSLDATWDALDNLRLRLGEQHLDQDLVVPTDSHFNRFEGTQLRSDAWRTTAGVDWDPVKALSLSALAHHTSDDMPHTTVVPESANDWTLRARWKPGGAWSATAMWRHVAGTNSTDVHTPEIGQNVDPRFGDPPQATVDLGSASRADTWSATGAWTRGPWSVRGTATYRRVDTSADTAFNQDVVIGPPGDEETVHRRRFYTVSFSARDLVANLDVRYDVTKSLRLFANGGGTDVGGDYDARWLQASIGGEYDVRTNLTLGLSLSTWHLTESDRGVDDYSTYGAEIWFTYRF